MSLVRTGVATDWSRRLVARLVEEGVIAGLTGEEALIEAGKQSKPVAVILVEGRFANPRVVLAELSDLAGVRTVDIFEERPMAEAFRLVPEMVARENGAIGYRLEEDRLTLASAEPLSNEAMRGLSGLLGIEISGYVLAAFVGGGVVLGAWIVLQWPNWF